MGNKETEPQVDNQTDKEVVAEKGFRDPRFLTPAMTTGLNADNVPEDYLEHLRNGGTKLER